MELTALPPPPPTPITLIFANVVLLGLTSPINSHFLAGFGFNLETDTIDAKITLLISICQAKDLINLYLGH